MTIRFNWFRHAMLALGLLSGATMLAAQPANEDKPAAGAAPQSFPHVTRVYPVADLVSGPMHFPLPDQTVTGASLMRPEENAASTSQGVAEGGMGGGFGGGGMGGGGMGVGGGGGGGMFRVPDHILPQFGGGGGGASQPALTGYSTTLNDLIALIYEHVRERRDRVDSGAEDGSTYEEISIFWQEIDGNGGEITALGLNLVVTHREDVHAKVADFLKTLRGSLTNRSVTLKVAILKTQSDAGEIDPATFDPKGAAAIVVMQCTEGYISHHSSGLRQRIVTGMTPVVGGELVGYSPRSMVHTTGLTTEARVARLQDENAQIDLAIGITEVNPAGTSPTVQFATGAEIDRGATQGSQFATSVIAPPDQWTLAGQVPSMEGNDMLAFLIQWTD